MRATFTDAQREWARGMDGRSTSRCADLIASAYRVRRLRGACLSACHRLEGGRFFSATLRRLLHDYHGVSVGRYSYGPCLVPGMLPAGTVVGSYCSLADGLSIHRRNHPPSTLSQHPFFYNSSLGLLTDDSIERVEDNPLVIGSDVWIGERTIVLPGCRRIGDGAVIGAGSIVTRDVEPFMVVAGNPAKPIRKRYSDDLVVEVQRSRWWDLSLSELLEADDLLVRPITFERLCRFADRVRGRRQAAVAV